MKKTIKIISGELEELRKSCGNFKVSSHIVWNSNQIKDIIDRFDKRNEIIKVGITHGFEPGKKCYQVIVYHLPFLE